MADHRDAVAKIREALEETKKALDDDESSALRRIDNAMEATEKAISLLSAIDQSAQPTITKESVVSGTVPAWADSFIEHDKTIIRDLQVLAYQKDTHFWGKAIASGVLRIMERLASTTQTVSQQEQPVEHNCKWPLCESENEQNRIAAEVATQLYGDSTAPVKQEPAGTGEVVAYLATDLDGNCDVGLTVKDAQHRAGEHCTHIMKLTWCDADQQAKEQGRDDVSARYKFMLDLLLDRGVIKKYESGTWVLRGIYGVDDSGLRGAGLSPEQALDNAIMAKAAFAGGSNNAG